MSSHEIDIEINGKTEIFFVHPIESNWDYRYDVFSEKGFICTIWYELDITGIIWCGDHKLIRQEIIDKLGDKIEFFDM